MKRNVHSQGRMLFVVLLLFSLVQAGAQTITLHLQNAPVERAFAAIQDQAPYRFIYTAELVKDLPPVSLRIEKVSVATALQKLFEPLPLTYSLEDDYILVRQKRTPGNGWPRDITGRVLDEKGTAIAGATVTVMRTRKGTSTTGTGQFLLREVDAADVLLVSSVGYKPLEQGVNGRTHIEVQLSISVSVLDAAIIKGYYTTSKRLDVGNVVKITKDQISAQPIANPLAILQGRAAGVFVTSSSGLPGSDIKIQIRGRNSIAAGNNPLYIVDGIPFPSVSLNADRYELQAANGLISPFNSINAADIESIEVLKDAEATAIYGSRGANGIVLITTKKGREGSSHLDLNFYQGFANTRRHLNMLSTAQYLSVRRKAFENDGIVPTTAKAPDLLAWDTTVQLDWQRFLTGGTALVSDAQVSLSGGNVHTRFLFSGHYRSEGTVFPGKLGYQRGGGHLSVENNAFKDKLNSIIQVHFTTDENKIIGSDLSLFYNLPPHYPLYDSSGEFYWGGYPNPLGALEQKSNSKTDNLLANASFRYTIFPGLSMKSSFGFNKILTDQVLLYPKTSQDPNLSPTGYARFGNNSIRQVIIEPQLDYLQRIGDKAVIKGIAGGTWQHNRRKSFYIEGQDYSSVISMESIAAAGSIRTRFNSTGDYKYLSFFGHLNFEWNRKYIVAGSFRRDGSSRFGENQRFGNFGAAAIGWIFSEENSVHKLADRIHLSFGKLKASYGTTGNDQIADFGYLDAYGTSSSLYQNSFLTPSRIANPYYSWEKNKKLEAGLELGFFKDRLFFSAAWYHNRSDNQLVSYPLPSQTGFNGYQANLNALVENTGWELELNATFFEKKNLSWKSAINLTLPKNKLVHFPGLSTSSYANTYVIGEPLSILKGYRYLGADPQTGIALFEDRDANGILSFPNDYIIYGNNAPAFYGGLSNTLSYHGFRIDLLFQFVKQEGRGIYNVPGGLINVTEDALLYWNKPGDLTAIPLPTATVGTPAFTANQNLVFSNALWTDASYARLKTLSISYNLPAVLLKNLRLTSLRFYVQGQNLLTLSRYKGLDPETQGVSLPPLRMLAAGIQITF